MQVQVTTRTLWRLLAGTIGRIDGVRTARVLLLVLFSVTLAGCAQLRLPRIDPSGNSIFLPAPNSTELLLPGANQAVAPTGNAPFNGGINPIFQPSPIAPGLASPPVAVGNPISAAPVPTQIAPPREIPPQAGPILPAFQPAPLPPPCNAMPVQRRRRLTPDPNRKLSPAQAGQVIMTPAKIIAPVGSEVVVLAGVCGEDGYFVKNQPLEWMLEQGSVGQFIEVGGMHHRAFNRLIPPTAKKNTGQHAWGRTGLKRLVLSRGTPTPDDDIDIAEGQTYITVASSAPGVSYVTSVAPAAEGWDRRRGVTKIHWVDANWSVPVPKSATAGTVTPLTTVVSRNDGSGVKDWPVRYTIIGGAAAEFAPTGTDSVEAKTDANGQATVQIRQPAGQFEPGTTQVRVDVIRPSILGQPELIVESGITTVTWSAPALTLRAIGPRIKEANETFEYRLEVTNPGDQIARDVVVRTKDLNDNIQFISATPKPLELGRQYEWRLGDIAPNAAPQVVSLQLSSQKLGNVGLCFEVSSDADQLRTEACAETEIVTPCLKLVIDSPSQARLGEPVLFTIQITNLCNQPLENVAMAIAYDAGLQRNGPNPTNVRLRDNGFLNVGQTEVYQFEAVAQGTGQQCIAVDLTANGVRPERQRACVNVTEASGVVPGSQPPVGQRSNNDALALDVVPTQPPAAVGPGVSTMQVRLTNNSLSPIEQITLTTQASDALSPAFVPEDDGRGIIGASTPAGAGQVLTVINRIEPGQTVVADFGFRGLQDDANASVQVTATSPSGVNVIDSARLPAIQAGGNPVPQGNPNADPDFGSDPGLGIPRDNLPTNPDAINPDFNGNTPAIPPLGGQPVRESVIVQVSPLNNVIQREQQTSFAFVVRNNTRQTLTNVNIEFIKPNTLVFGDRQRFFNTAGLQLLPGFRLPRLETFRPGESLEGQIELMAGSIPGTAIFEIQLQSDQTRGTLSDQASVQIQ